MNESLGQTLRVVFRRPSPSTEDVAAPPATKARATQQVEFVAYGEDCVLSGITRMAADRLTDMLNDHDEYLLVDVLVEGLGDDERAVEVTEVLVLREELLLVHAAGPRGNQGRRHRTRSHAVAIQVGPYRVRGHLHALPGSDPVQAIRRRKTMVPLTDAWIEFPESSGRERRRVGTVVVNQQRIASIAPVEEDEVEMPDLPMNTEKGRLLKDFTGSLFDGR